MSVRTATAFAGGRRLLATEEVRQIEDEAALQPSEDKDATAFSWKALAGIGAWLVLLAVGSGPRLLHTGFWFSMDGVLFVLAAILPSGLLLAWIAIAERLTTLQREQAEVNRALLGLADPGPGSSGNIVSIRHAVHRELASFNEQLDRSLDRTGEIETVIRREVESLDQTFAENERRMLALVQELARQRETVLAATDQVREVVRENREALGNDLSALGAEVLQAGNYARSMVEEVSGDLKAELAAHGGQFASDLRQIVTSEIQPVSALLDSQVRSIMELVSTGNSGLVTLLETEGETLVSRMQTAWSKVAADLEARAHGAEEAARRLSGVLEESLGSNVNRLENLIERTSLEVLGVLDGAAEQTAQRFAEIGSASSESLDARATALNQTIAAQIERLESLVAGGAERLMPALDKHSATVERAIGLEAAFEQSTNRLSEVLGQQASALVDSLAGSLRDFQRQLGEQSGAVSEELTGKLDHAVAGLEEGSRRFEATLRNVKDGISLASDRLAIAVSAYNADFAQSVDQIGAMMADGSERLEKHLTRGVATLETTLGSGSREVEAALETWTRRLDETLSGNLTRADAATATRLAEAEAMTRDHQQRLATNFSDGTGRLGALIAEGGATLAGAADAASRDMERAGDRFADELGTLRQTLAGEADAFTATARTSLDAAGRETLAEIEQRMNDVHAAFAGGLTPAYEALQARVREFEARVDQFDAGLDARTGHLNHIMSQASQSVEQAVAQGVGLVEKTLTERLSQTRALIETFSEDEARTFRTQLDTLSRILDEKAATFEQHLRGVHAMLTTQSRELETRIDRFGGGMEQHAARLTETIGAQTQFLSQSLGTALAETEQKLAAQVNELRSLIAGFTEKEAAELERHVDVLTRTLDSRAELLDSIMRTRGTEFTDKLYASSRQFEEELAETSRQLESTLRSGGSDIRERIAAQLAEMRAALEAGIRTLGDGTDDGLSRLDERLTAAARDMTAIVGNATHAIGSALDGTSSRLEQTLDAGGHRVTNAVASESQRLTDALAQSAAELNHVLAQRTSELEQHLRTQAETVAAAADEGSARVASAVSQAAVGLEKKIDEDVAAARVALERSLDAATRALATGVEGTRQQIAGSVDKLLTRLNAHEKTATARMEDAAASVGDSTRKAAELTAERLVTLNGALVQVLSSLGTTRPTAAPRRPKVETIIDAAE